jgi:hypothetical protein
MNAACVSAIDCANACISKGAAWQACFLGTARDNALVSACLDHDLPYHHGRGFDLLPAETKAAYESAFATTLDRNELTRALEVIAGNIGDSTQVQASAMPELVEADRGIGLAWLICTSRAQLYLEKKSLASRIHDSGYAGLHNWACPSEVERQTRLSTLPGIAICTDGFAFSRYQIASAQSRRIEARIRATK